MGRKKSTPSLRHAASSTSIPKYAITEEEIRQRAFENYILRGGGAGDAVSDWLKAEAELREISHRQASESAFGETRRSGGEATWTAETKERRP